MQRMTIGRLAKEAGVNVQTIRYYERRGLIPEPPRRESGYREYSPEVLARIRFVQRAKKLGFSLREIAGLLSLRVDPSITRVDVRSRAEAKIREIDEKIRSLRGIRDALKRLASSCRGDGPASDCPILEALEDHEMGQSNTDSNRREWIMSKTRKVEIFSAGCPVCLEAVDRIRQMACPSCEVRILDMTDPGVASRAGRMGIRSVPAVAIDGVLVDCCVGRGPDESTLRAAGIGRSL